jgi:hypothetical protein
VKVGDTVSPLVMVSDPVAVPSRPEELHLEPLTEPYVKLSLHTARVIHQGCRLSPLCWVLPGFPVDPERRGQVGPRNCTSSRLQIRT